MSKVVRHMPFLLRSSDCVLVVNACRLVLTYLRQQVFCILQRPFFAHGSVTPTGVAGVCVLDWTQGTPVPCPPIYLNKKYQVVSI